MFQIKWPQVGLDTAAGQSAHSLCKPSLYKATGHQYNVQKICLVSNQSHIQREERTWSHLTFPVYIGFKAVGRTLNTGLLTYPQVDV